MSTKMIGLSSMSVLLTRQPARFLALVITVLYGGLSTVALHAADEPSPSSGTSPQVTDDERWRFNVAPYLWGASLNGDVKIGRVEEDVDLNFIDILKYFSFGGMLYAEARKPSYGFFTNMFFVRTRDDSSGTVDTDVTSDTAQIALGGFYRVVEWQWGESADGHPLRLAVEPLAGFRWSYLRSEIELSGGGAVNLPQADRSESFVDPLVGVRIGSGLSENWLAFIEGDVGGFSLGSDYSWNVQGYVGYRMAMLGIPTVLSAGYRALHQKYKDGDFKWDVTQHGPILGLVFAF
jgi:hypothetical protein